ncbi:MAG: 16S rRNA (cytidine(1402)-2'-O)-methyltransferase [Chloroflexi bacterium RBG_13_66_10]|nr:MAG: 16S rRNA (cytidine(1402)-2'-O)-methyltransferase [Chloroflexi bacterium RBG_13_66_10]
MGRVACSPSLLCYNSAVGTLYLVATPIGNLEDITLRALRTLSQVRLIAAEDTRQTRKLLAHYQIVTPMLSYHEHNKLARLGEVLAALSRGDVALVSDAGTPGLSDPGLELVRAALRAGHQVSPLPGPSAPIAALVASGLATDAFLFLGYLPRRPLERRRLIETLAQERRTLLAFEVPHRLVDSLADLATLLGADRPVAVCRELSKVHEEITRGTLADARRRFEAEPPRGEVTLVVGGAEEAARWPEEAVRAALEQRAASGVSRSQASREVARLSGWPKREVYRLAEGQ